MTSAFTLWRGSYSSVDDLEAAIYDYVARHNAKPKPFKWGPVERLAGDLGFGRGPEGVEVAPQMGPTDHFAQTARAIGFRFVELAIAFVTVGLKNAADVGQMTEDVLFLPVRCEGIDSAGR